MVNGGAEIQTENGFVKVHPAILELLASADLTASEFKCVLFLLRKTYGWGKKEDTLSYGQIAEATGLSRRGVIGSMQSLIDKKVVRARDTKIGRNGCRTYGFNKYFEQWAGVINSELAFTISSDDNSEPACTIAPVNGEQPFTIKPEMVNASSLEMVNASSPTIDIKESKEQQLPPPDPALAQFDASYRRVWALVPASEYEVEKIAGWAKRVTLEAWEYALQESVDNGATGKWRYLERILQRVEREGFQNKRNGSTPPPIVPPVVPVVKPEVNPWQI